MTRHEIVEPLRVPRDGGESLRGIVVNLSNLLAGSFFLAELVLMLVLDLRLVALTASDPRRRRHRCVGVRDVRQSGDVLPQRYKKLITLTDQVQFFIFFVFFWTIILLSKSFLKLKTILYKF